jgi:hypothetical protein
MGREVREEDDPIPVADPTQEEVNSSENAEEGEESPYEGDAEEEDQADDDDDEEEEEEEDDDK